MRTALIAIPLLLAASPALAQRPAAKPQTVPPELTDPRMGERLGRMTEVLGKALLDLPVGELEAIAEGRQPSAADRRRTVRDTDPDLSRDVQQQIAQARPVMESSLKALTAALPAMLKSLEQAGQALDRAAANLPSPTYPKR